MEDKILRNIFDPGWFVPQPREKLPEEMKNERILERGEFERRAYKEIISNLTEDMEDLGIKVNYASKIIIGEIAMSLIFVSRIKFELIEKAPIQPKMKFKESSLTDSISIHSRRKGHSVTEEGEIVHPSLDLFFKLEKRINKNLELIGLLPKQQVERRKLIIIQKLKQRLVGIENKDQKCEINAIYEKERKI